MHYVAISGIFLVKKSHIPNHKEYTKITIQNYAFPLYFLFSVQLSSIAHTYHEQGPKFYPQDRAPTSKTNNNGNNKKTGMVAHGHNSSTHETEKGGL